MKNFVQEIHQRSLWQVLGIYLAGSWIALQVVEQLTEAAGLPEWVRPFSLVLLVLGLPVVMATAFIQKGVGRAQPGPDTTVRPEAAGTQGAQQAAAALTDSPAPQSATPEIGAHHRLFTWRNATIGGVGAFAVMGLLTVGYLVMRSSGIGPAGTLVAKGVLEEGAPVVLADFDGSDPELAGVVAGALRIDLFQSPTIRIVERAELAGALGRMQRDGDTPITSAVAREIAVREGYGAVIEGEIGTVGSGYVLTARIVGGEDWAPLAAFRETARSEDDLIDAIEALSRSIRDKAGESLRTVQGSPPLENVTTGSLEALRLYTRGDATAGDDAAAAALFERAIEADPDFAMAHRKLGVMLWNLGVRPGDMVAATTRAYELRERLPDAERYLAEADYEDLVRGNRDASMRAFENVLELDPQNEAALNNLGLLYGNRGRFEEAEELYERAVGVRPFEVAYLNLARARIALGRMDEMHAALDSGVANLPEASSVFENVRVLGTLSDGDYERASELSLGYLERFSDPAGRRRAANQQFRLAAAQGRLSEAERHIDDFDLVPGRLANPMVMASAYARVGAARGEGDAAVRDLLDAYAAARDGRTAPELVYDVWLPTLMEIGGADEAATIYEEWKRVTPEEHLGTFGRDARRALDARFALHDGRTDEAVRLWDAYEQECPGLCAIQAALGRADVYEATGDASSAIAEYEAFLATRHWFRFATDAFRRAPVLERLGQLYDEASDIERATRHYSAFVGLWADADEVLQPRVRAAQARLDEIQGVSE